MRARDLGLVCGSLPPGERNSIADVRGVTVGHAIFTEGAHADAAIEGAASACLVRFDLGNGSGDIALTFSTGNCVPHVPDKDLLEQSVLAEGWVGACSRSSVTAREKRCWTR